VDEAVKIRLLTAANQLKKKKKKNLKKEKASMFEFQNHFDQCPPSPPSL
jgi:hypothetical protein